MFRSLMMVCVLSLVGVCAQASLLGRAALTPGGTDYRAYYDNALNITWLANANLAATHTFGVLGICTASGTTTGCAGPGSLTWAKANEWIAAMNTANYLGISNWRLPNIIDTGTPGCDWAFNGTDCGFTVDLSTGEMAHLYYSTLGNSAGYNTSGAPQPCDRLRPIYCLTNIGPFSNLEPSIYWSGATYTPNTSLAWISAFWNGVQGQGTKINNGYAWAVHTGDIAVVPLPPAAWLFGSALGLMGVMRRKISSKPL